MACCYNNFHVMRPLLKYGANVNTQDWSGNDPQTRLRTFGHFSEKLKLCTELIDQYSKVKQTKTSEKSKESKKETKKDKKCNSCGKESKMRCGRCQTVYYCDQNCQKKDWASHKLNCNKL